jgi:hypothetical protein
MKHSSHGGCFNSCVFDMFDLEFSWKMKRCEAFTNERNELLLFVLFSLDPLLCYLNLPSSVLHTRNLVRFLDFIVSLSLVWSGKR